MTLVWVLLEVAQWFLHVAILFVVLFNKKFEDDRLEPNNRTPPYLKKFLNNNRNEQS